MSSFLVSWECQLQMCMYRLISIRCRVEYVIIIDLYKTLNIVSNLSEPFVGLFTLHKILIFFSFE